MIFIVLSPSFLSKVTVHLTLAKVSRPRLFFSLDSKYLLFTDHSFGTVKEVSMSAWLEKELVRGCTTEPADQLTRQRGSWLRRGSETRLTGDHGVQLKGDREGQLSRESSGQPMRMSRSQLVMVSGGELMGGNGAEYAEEESVSARGTSYGGKISGTADCQGDSSVFRANIFERN
jgi:hypothetical protein